MNEGTFSRTLAAFGLLAYCLGLAFILLNASAGLPTSSVLLTTDVSRDLGVPEILLAGARVEFILNALMFTPVPLLGSIVWPESTWRDWTAYVFVAAGFVELVQGVLLPDRSATFVDIVANTLGGALGGMFALGLRVLFGGQAGRRTTPLD